MAVAHFIVAARFVIDGCQVRGATLENLRRYRQVVVDIPPPNRLVKQFTVGGGSGSDEAGVAWGTCTMLHHPGRMVSETAG
jgi:hypothetical protein